MRDGHGSDACDPFRYDTREDYTFYGYFVSTFYSELWLSVRVDRRVLLLHPEHYRS